jgi:hypothetical protein
VAGVVTSISSSSSSSAWRFTILNPGAMLVLSRTKQSQRRLAAQKTSSSSSNFPFDEGKSCKLVHQLSSVRRHQSSQELKMLFSNHFSPLLHRFFSPLLPASEPQFSGGAKKKGRKNGKFILLIRNFSNWSDFGADESSGCLMSHLEVTHCTSEVFRFESSIIRKRKMDSLATELNLSNFLRVFTTCEGKNLICLFCALLHQFIQFILQIGVLRVHMRAMDLSWVNTLSNLRLRRKFEEFSVPETIRSSRILIFFTTGWESKIFLNERKARRRKLLLFGKIDR